MEFKISDNNLYIKDKEHLTPCPRCSGNGIFHVAILNNHGIPSKQDAGICYACNGTGVETKPNQNNKEDSQMNQLTPKQLVRTVFEVMAELISKKGKTTKMVSVFDIHDVLKAQNILVSKIDIEACLDKLIQLKYVRYYKDARRYIYFGITQQGWAERALHIAKQATQYVQQEIAIDENVQTPTA